MKSDQESDHRGFTLLEVLVSMALFSIAATAIAHSFIFFTVSNTANEIRSQAVAAAQQVVDDLRTVDPATLPSSGAGAAIPVEIGQRTFSVVPSYCERPSLCTTIVTRHVTARVYYRHKKRYQVETVFTQLR